MVKRLRGKGEKLNYTSPVLLLPMPVNDFEWLEMWSRSLGRTAIKENWVASSKAKAWTKRYWLI